MINIVIITYLHDTKIYHLFNNGTTGEKIDLRTLPAQRLVIFKKKKEKGRDKKRPGFRPGDGLTSFFLFGQAPAPSASPFS